MVAQSSKQRPARSSRIGVLGLDPSIHTSGSANWYPTSLEK